MENLKLLHVENNRKIDMKTDKKFLHFYQRALLLALKELNLLTAAQFQYADSALSKQFSIQNHCNYED